MKKHLTLSQRIHNAEGAVAAEYLHARHSFLHAVAYGKEEWGEFWSRDDETSWGHSFGRFRGFDSIWYNSVAMYNETGYGGYNGLCEKYPELAWYDPRAVRECAMHTLGTDIVEVADDGMSARASFLTPGVLFTALSQSGKFMALTLWERYGADFVYEDGRWLFFHEQVCPDMGGPSDMVNPGNGAYTNLVSGIVAQKAGGAKGNTWINEKIELHENYSPVQPVQDTVPYPVPYKTLDENNSYAPKRNKATEQPKPEPTGQMGGPGGGGPGGGGPGGGGPGGGGPGGGGPGGGGPGGGGPGGGAPGGGMPGGGAPGGGALGGGAPAAAKSEEPFKHIKFADLEKITPHDGIELFRMAGHGMDGVNMAFSYQLPHSTREGSTPVDNLMFVVEGKLKVTRNGETFEAGPGDVMYFAAGENKVMENESDEKVAVLLIDKGMGGGGGAPGGGMPGGGPGGAPGGGPGGPPPAR